MYAHNAACWFDIWINSLIMFFFLKKVSYNGILMNHLKSRSAVTDGQRQGEENTIQADIGALHAPDQASEKSAFICMSGSHQRVEGEERSDTQQQENLDVFVCMWCTSLMKYNSRTTSVFKGDDVNVRTEKSRLRSVALLSDSL